MEAVTNIVFDKYVAISEEGWMSVIEHTGLRHMEVRWGAMIRVEPGLVGRLVTSMETVKVEFLTLEQMTVVFTYICDSETLTLKVLDLSYIIYRIVRRVEPGLLARAVTRLEEVNLRGTVLTEEQVTAILRALCDGAVVKLKMLDLTHNYKVQRLDSGLLAKAVVRLEEVNLGDTDLTEEQMTAILRAICGGAVYKLRVLDLSWNQNVKRMEPGLLAGAVTKLETLYVKNTTLTMEQGTAIREAIARSS